MNALCNLSRKKSREVAASLPDRFLSRLCRTMEVEPRIACRSTKATTVAIEKNYRRKGMEGGGKVSLRRFFS